MNENSTIKLAMTRNLDGLMKEDIIPVIMKFRSFFFDDLTKTLKRPGLLHLIDKGLDESGKNISFIYVDQNKLAKINRHGMNEGDEAISTMASILRTHFEGFKLVRLSGDEFLIIGIDIEQEDIDKMMSGAREDADVKTAELEDRLSDNEVEISWEYGISVIATDDYTPIELRNYIARAEENMRGQKQQNEERLLVDQIYKDEAMALFLKKILKKADIRFDIIDENDEVIEKFSDVKRDIRLSDITAIIENDEEYFRGKDDSYLKNLLMELASYCMLNNSPNILTDMAKSFITDLVDKDDYTAHVLEVRQLKPVNTIHGHSVGDALIDSIINIMDSSINSKDKASNDNYILRVNGNTFVMFIPKLDNCEVVISDIIERIECFNEEASESLKIKPSIKKLDMNLFPESSGNESEMTDFVRYANDSARNQKLIDTENAVTVLLRKPKCNIENEFILSFYENRDEFTSEDLAEYLLRSDNYDLRKCFIERMNDNYLLFFEDIFGKILEECDEEKDLEKVVSGFTDTDLDLGNEID